MGFFKWLFKHFRFRTDHGMVAPNKCDHEAYDLLYHFAEKTIYLPVFKIGIIRGEGHREALVKHKTTEELIHLTYSEFGANDKFYLEEQTWEQIDYTWRYINGKRTDEEKRRENPTYQYWKMIEDGRLSASKSEIKRYGLVERDPGPGYIVPQYLFDRVDPNWKDK